MTNSKVIIILTILIFLKKNSIKEIFKKTLETKYYTNSKNNKLYLKVRQESFSFDNL